MQFYGKSIRNSRAVVREETLDGDVKRSIIRLLATNKELDFYGTRMQESSLKNYVADAKEGVTFADSHNWRSTGYGRSVDAERIGDDVFVDVAVLHDEKWNGMTYASGADLMFALKNRAFDVSIGFANERMVCSVSGELLWTDDSPYFLGEEVVVDGKKRLVEGLIEDANLTEVSIVYDGATPGAGTAEISDDFRERVIAKTDALIRAGKAKPQQLVDMCKRLRIPAIEVETEPKSRKPKTRSRRMPKSVEALETKVEDLEEELSEVNDEIKDLREQRKTDRAEIKKLRDENRALKEVETQIESIESEIRKLCIDEKTELLKKKGETPTDEELKGYRTKLDDMRYQTLREELEDLGSQRDIIIAIEKKEEEGDGEPADPLPGDGKDEIKVHQPFMRQRRVFGM